MRLTSAHSNLVATLPPPKRFERAIEDRKLLLPMDEQGAACVIHLLAGSYADVTECVDDVKESSGVDVDAGPPQRPAKQQQVRDDREGSTVHYPGGALRAAARSSISAA
jgi:hypothetical protein